LKQSLHEAMGWEGPLTARQYEVWQAWLDLQWNRPSRTDHYLMQIAAQVTRAAAKNPRSVKSEGFKIEFKTRDTPKNPAQKQIELQQSKARWGAILGKPASEVGKGGRPLVDQYGDTYGEPIDPGRNGE